MANRTDRKRRFRTDAQHATLRAGDVAGTYEFKVELQKLQQPEREFYCNAARYQKRPNAIAFVFGQLGVGSSSQNAVTVDVPYRSIKPLVGTFDDVFRGKLGQVCRNLAPITPFSSVDKLQTLSYPGHLAKVLVSDYAGVVDFYEIEPTFGSGAPTITPIIRIKGLPDLSRWFVDSCDQVAAELGSAWDESMEEK